MIEALDPALEVSDEPSVNPYREAAMRYLHIMTIAATHVAESSSPHVAIWGVIYALGLPCAEGVSLTDRADQLGVSAAALSKQARIIQRACGIEESSYSYHKDKP